MSCRAGNGYGEAISVKGARALARRNVVVQPESVHTRGCLKGTCKVCYAKTPAGRPWCSEHSPYASKIRAELKRREGAA